MNVSASRILKHADEQASDDAYLASTSPRYAGPLTVGALTSKMGAFAVEMDSLVLKGRKLDFEMSGTDGTGKFMVEGSASLDPGSEDFVCPSASVSYTPEVAPSIPTRFVFTLRQVTADNRPLCYISLRWVEDESNHWIAFALLEVAANQHAR